MSARRTRRATPGSGSVYKHDTRDLWVGQVTVNGRRQRVYGATKTEARAKLNTLLATGPRAKASITVEALLDDWRKRDVAGRNLAPGTLARHDDNAKRIKASLGSIRADKLTVRDVEHWLDGMVAEGLARATVTKCLNVLGQVLDYGLRRDDVSRNVARVAKLPPDAKPAERRRALMPDEARKLLAVLPTVRNGLMYALSLKLGLRPGEAAALCWDDLDLDAGVLHVQHGIQRHGERAVVVDTLKTDASRRSLTLPPDVLADLKAHRREQAAERLAATRWDDDRLVFATKLGTPLHPRNGRRELVRACKKAGIASIRPNELRHSCASYLSDQGVPHTLIADLLGHTTTRMVDSTYRHRLRPVVAVPAVDWTAAESG